MMTACASEPAEQWGPVIDVGASVSTSAARFEVVSLRCNPTECVVFERVQSLSKGRGWVSWTQSVSDSSGAEYKGANGPGPTVFMEQLPPGVQHPFFAEIPLHPPFQHQEIPSGRTIVATTIDGHDIAVGPVMPSASQGPVLGPSGSYGSAVPIGRTVSATTAYGDFKVELVSMRCSQDACEFSEKVAGQDADPNWWQYPVWQQSLVD